MKSQTSGCSQIKHLKSKHLKVRRDKNEGETLGETFRTAFID